MTSEATKTRRGRCSQGQGQEYTLKPSSFLSNFDFTFWIRTFLRFAVGDALKFKSKSTLRNPHIPSSTMTLHCWYKLDRHKPTPKQPLRPLRCAVVDAQSLRPGVHSETLEGIVPCKSCCPQRLLRGGLMSVKFGPAK